MLTWRDLLWCAVVGIAVGLATLWAERWLTIPAPRPAAPDPADQQVWSVLDEARRITMQAAQEPGA